jgi:predicted dehydrogenase/nucleoside-diphosphate-sugar epimerase
VSGPRTFRVGLVGAGYVSEFHYRALERLPQVRVTGITDVDATRAASRAREFGIPSFASLADLCAAGVDVVHVMTPPDTHVAVAIEAMERGADVLIEKPLATGVEDCDRLIEAAARLGRRAAVNHSLLGDPLVRRALAAVRSGAIGRVQSVDIYYSSEYSPWAGGPPPPQYREGGYPFRDLGVHHLYLIRELLGEIRGVDARFRTRGGDPNLRYDEWRAVVECEGGSAVTTLTWSARPLQHHFVVYGTSGSIRVDLALMFMTRRRSLPLPNAVERIVNAFLDSAPPLWQVPANILRFLTKRLRPYQALHNWVADFYANLAGEPTPIATLAAGREVVDWVERGARPADEAKSSWTRRFAPSGQPAVVVTGAAGFVGRHLVERLLAGGERVRLLTRADPPRAWQEREGVECVTGDLGDSRVAADILRGATGIFHLAATTSGGWEDHLRGTVAATRHVVDACLLHSVPWLVYVSSLSVIDWAGLDGKTVTEDSPLEPRPEERGNYTRAKLEAERIVLDAVRDRGLRAIVLRPGQIFGPDGPIVGATGGLQAGKRLVLLGGGPNRLPLVYVEDVVDALIRSRAADRFDGRIFHVVDETVVTQREFAQRVAATFDLSVVRLPGLVVSGLAVGVSLLGRVLKRSVPLTPYKLRSLNADPRFEGRRIREELGWQPRVGTKEGLRRSLDERAR